MLLSAQAQATLQAARSSTWGSRTAVGNFPEAAPSRTAHSGEPLWLDFAQQISIHLPELTQTHCPKSRNAFSDTHTNIINFLRKIQT